MALFLGQILPHLLKAVQFLSAEILVADEVLCCACVEENLHFLGVGFSFQVKSQGRDGIRIRIQGVAAEKIVPRMRGIVNGKQTLAVFINVAVLLHHLLKGIRPVGKGSFHQRREYMVK